MNDKTIEMTIETIERLQTQTEAIAMEIDDEYPSVGRYLVGVADDFDEAMEMIENE